MVAAANEFISRFVCMAAFWAPVTWKQPHNEEIRVHLFYLNTVEILSASHLLRPPDLTPPKTRRSHFPPEAYQQLNHSRFSHVPLCAFVTLPLCCSWRLTWLVVRGWREERGLLSRTGQTPPEQCPAGALVKAGPRCVLFPFLLPLGDSASTVMVYLLPFYAASLLLQYIW